MNKRSKRLTDQERIDLVKKYKTGNYTTVALAKEYKISAAAVWGLLTRRKIPIFGDQSVLQRKYGLDYNILDKIDTEEKAYFLGFFYADGYNNEPKTYIKIALAEEDKEILVKFQNLFKTDRPLSLETTNKKKNPKHQNVYVFHVASTKISKRLKELGAPRAKTFIMKFPSTKQVPKHLIRHFIRGYFDGDGSCCRYFVKNETYAKYICSITSTLDILEEIQKILKKELNIHLSISPHLKSKGIYVGSISGPNSCQIFLDYIYKDSLIYLERKYTRYLLYKELRNEDLSRPFTKCVDRR